MASPTCITRNIINFIPKFGPASSIFPGLIQVQHYAARKSTREKALKKKIKIMAEKLTHKEKIKNIRKSKVIKSTLPDTLLYINNQKKPLPVDDVYYRKYYRWITYPFDQAIANYREYFDPTMYNQVDSYVNIFIEVNLKSSKKRKHKMLDVYQKLVPMKHTFEMSEKKKILAFCESDEVAKLKAAGATTAGGSEIVKQILNGEILISDYNTVISKTSLMAEVLTLRGLLKKKMPSIKSDTLGIDLLRLIRLHLHGVNYTVRAYEDYPEYGYANVCIGKLNMETQQLEENLQCVIDSMMASKQPSVEKFITRIRTQCPGSKEAFQIDHKLYTKEEDIDAEKKDNDNDDEDDDDADDDEDDSVKEFEKLSSVV